MMEARIWKEPKGYTVWTVSPLTGDRKDCLGHFDRKASAVATMRAHNSAKTFEVFWSPEGRKVATVTAKDARAAIRKAPRPYRKCLGELYAQERQS